MARRTGDSFGSAGFKAAKLAPAAGRRAGDSFGQGLGIASGVFPRKGKGWGVAGEATYPDILNEWDRKQGWTPWRQGMTLAFNDLLQDTQQFQPVQVLSRPAWVPQEGWTYRPALTVGFPSRTSPEGRWTVTLKPRGTDISVFPLDGNAQKQLLLEDAGLGVPILQVEVGATWGEGALSSASSLVGELVEDSAPSRLTIDPEDDEAVILLCVGVYPEDGLMLFDASQVWRRVLQPNGRRVLTRRLQKQGDPPLQFRQGRHLVQSTTLSCNCPAYLGLEYARLRPGSRLGGQELFPQRGPSQDGFRREGQDGLGTLLAAGQPEVRAVDPLEGVARRFATLNWQRVPEQACKHIHAVRFALGCPIEEPDEYLSLASDYWSGLQGMGSMEELIAPLASARFVDQLRRRLFNEEAFRGLSSTISSGSIGDAHGIVPGRLVLDPRQVKSSLPSEEDASRLRFNEQAAISDPLAAEETVQGDLWVGRGTETASRIYEAPQELIDADYAVPATEPVPVSP
jgi:hypothetical protein